jgi:catechol 2,3-dioxygenase-like lactoylglutathione lyase family enzyme
MTDTSPRLRLTSTVLGTPDPRALAAFYQRLLGWQIGTDEPTWVTLRPADGGRWLSFQLETHHVRPVWPATPGEPQMTAHLDIAVDDLVAACAHAEAAGAVPANFQPQDDVRVFLDPDGHLFCLYLSDP